MLSLPTDDYLILKRGQPRNSEGFLSPERIDSLRIQVFLKSPHSFFTVFHKTCCLQQLLYSYLHVVFSGATLSHDGFRSRMLSATSNAKWLQTIQLRSHNNAPKIFPIFQEVLYCVKQLQFEHIEEYWTAFWQPEEDLDDEE